MLSGVYKLLHDGGLYWVTISTLDCQRDKVKYHDFMFKGKLIESVKNQICCITRLKDKNIKIDVVSNGFSCSAYVITFMAFIVNKKVLQAYLLMK